MHPRIRVIATQHLDVAYLWERSPAGEDLMIECFERALQMLEERPSRAFRFSRSTAWSFHVLELRRPDLFPRVAEHVRSGRIEVAGGQWVEPDNVLPGGEAMVRQGLYGQSYFADRFGKTARVAWNPDVFGHPATLPQILRGCGLEGYYFHRCIPTSAGGQIKQFTWRGQDSSEVLCLAGNWRGEPVREALEECIQDIRTTGLPMSFLATGANSDRRVTMEPGWPASFDEVRADRRGADADWSFAEEVVDDMRDYRERLPVIEGDLGFQFTGTYTTEGNIKRRNRRMEALLADTEKLAVSALLQGFAYPADGLREAWRDLCVNGFHDIICGTCYQYIHEEALDLYARIETRTHAAQGAAWAHLHGADSSESGITLFNSLSYERQEPLLLPSTMAKNLPGPMQEVEGPAGESLLLTLTPAVPPFGFAMLGSGKAPGPLSASAHPGVLVLENQYLRAEIDGATGELRGLTDLARGEEVLSLELPSNRLVFYGDRTPLENFEPWYIDYTGEAFESEVVDAPRITEDGPVRVSVSTGRRGILGSDLPPTLVEQHLQLYSDLPYLVVALQGNWQARNVLLKAEFDFPFPCSRVVSELGFGVLETRPGSQRGAQIVQKDSSVEDGLEHGSEIPDPDLPMHRWVDYEGEGRGVAILNDGKYGFDLSSRGVRLSLMRAPRHRDGNLVGLGEFSFNYAILPHPGDWRSADIPFQAVRFNHPLRWHPGEVCPDLAARGRGLLSVSRRGIEISAVKPAEDGDGLILRLFDSFGTGGEVTLSSALPLEGVKDNDLIEQPHEPELPAILQTEKNIRLTLRPFEIRTLRLYLAS